MQTIIYQIGEHELRAMMTEAIKAAKTELETEMRARNTETYHSADDVAKRYQLDRSTLYRWEKRQYLIPFRVGGKLRYKGSDLKRVLEGGVS